MRHVLDFDWHERLKAGVNDHLIMARQFAGGRFEFGEQFAGVAGFGLIFDRRPEAGTGCAANGCDFAVAVQAGHDANERVIVDAG